MSMEHEFCYYHDNIEPYGQVLVIKSTPFIGSGENSHLSVICNVNGIRFDAGFTGGQEEIDAQYESLRKQAAIQGFLAEFFEEVSRQTPYWFGPKGGRAYDS